MPTGTITSTATVGGLSISSTTSRTATLNIGLQDSLPIAVTGTLKARTSDTVGTLTLAADHGVTAGDILTIFWTAADNVVGGTAGACYNCIAGEIDELDVPFTAGEGTALPLITTVVTVDEQVSHDIDFDGDNVEMMVLTSTQHAHVLFLEGAAATLAAVELTANEPWVWVADQGIANPLTGVPVDDIEISQGSSTSAATIKLGILYDTE